MIEIITRKKKHILTLKLVSVLMMYLTSCGCSKPAQTNELFPPEPQKEKIESEADFPILAWLGVPPGQNISAYNTMKEAGFSYDLMGQVGTTSQIEIALNMAQKIGIKGLVSAANADTRTERVNKFKNHPALLGYTIYDEPRMHNIETVKERMNAVYSLDKQHIRYVNLLSSITPEWYLGAPFTQYFEEVTKLPLDLLSFSFYPIALRDGKTEVEIDSKWYENLEIFSKKSQEMGIPLWTLNLSSAHHHLDRLYPEPTIAHLRLQVYSNLAYGSQVMQFYTYWEPSASKIEYKAPINLDGTKSVIYDKLKEVNQEIISLSGVFLGAKKLDVWHTGDNIPLGTKSLVISEPFEILETDGDGALVSLLENRGRRYLMVVNRSISNHLSLNIKANSTVQEVDKKAFLSTDRLDELKKYNIAPGDMRLFTWKISE